MYNEYYTPYDDYAYQIMINDDVERKMHGQKRKALDKLFSNAAQLTESLGKLLVYSWLEGFPIAEKIIDGLNLSKMDLLAINEDFDEFKEELMKDSIAENF